MVDARTILVYGLVQGVGFRPFLHRIAGVHQVVGRVRNRNDCVEIRVEGGRREIDSFVAALTADAPPLARITRISTEPKSLEGFADFAIVGSANSSDAVTRVAPDTAICSDCLSDMRGQPRRNAYPFTNCTNCGPRFSIVQSLPYDRPGTTMSVFAMCDDCSREYRDIVDRRYHAQPNACKKCGPEYSITGQQDATELTRSATAVTADSNTDSPIGIAAHAIDAGSIVAIKGIGGFHLACDAGNDAAVRNLRSGKRREGKPFAVMCRNIEAVKRIASIDEHERALLSSIRAPIVVLKKKNSIPIAPSVTVGLDTIGAMLPYAPVHHVLFDHLKTDVLVMTSGNLSDEPIAITNADAMQRLLPICESVLHHNRDIYNRVDDSIAYVVRGSTRFLRRARGFVPEPIAFGEDIEGIAAVGGELKNVFCLGKGSEAILSQHIGDLKTPENLEFYEESFSRMMRLFRFTPSLIACDLHPDYLSTRFARTLALRITEDDPFNTQEPRFLRSTGDTRNAERINIPIVFVQHHHAHVAAVLAEHGCEKRVIGVSFDGTGYGDDGNIWGGEVLIASRRDYRRFAHLDYIALPGGDRAVYEPWRIALSLLRDSFGADKIPFELFSDEENGEAPLLLAMIDRGINTPLSSGIGRLFDGVAALCGIARKRAYEAEGPMRFEAALEREWEDEEPYSFDVVSPDRAELAEASGCYRMTWHKAIREIVQDIKSGVTVSRISGRFHRGLGQLIQLACTYAAEATGDATVALSGGVFQNRRLSDHVEGLLENAGFAVLVPRHVPANDGGLCLGQLAVAAAQRQGSADTREQQSSGDVDDSTTAD